MGKIKYGYMDASGVEVIPPTFNNAFVFLKDWQSQKRVPSMDIFLKMGSG